MNNLLAVAAALYRRLPIPVDLRRNMTEAVYRTLPSLCGSLPTYQRWRAGEGHHASARSNPNPAQPMPSADVCPLPESTVGTTTTAENVRLVETAASTSEDDYKRRAESELTTFNSYVNVHNLPEIFHYWSGKHLAPIVNGAGFSTMSGFFAMHLAESARRTESGVPRFLSVGAGNCDLEISIATELIGQGFSTFTIECLELNQVMLDRGRELAAHNGVLSHLQFESRDFNTWTASKTYDGVMANQSLHHVTNLEGLFDQISVALHEKALFVVCDTIGRNGHQRWPEALEEVHRIWQKLPERQRYNHMLNRTEPMYINWDCSTEGFEGIRAQDILPLLIERFSFELFVPYGNVTDVFIDRAFGHNFDPAVDADRAVIDEAHAADEQGFAAGTITPTHMFAVLGKSPVPHPLYSRNLHPAACVRRESELEGDQGYHRPVLANE